ncbi:MAG: ribosomal-processing cysteine protease Prp [Spirochaetaceae bacterium]|jgi:uncharacterized protein YsxB (DUF464 family)|nr:ribosomal-processing cysteine protease Prp [Spirochaetaceae bacterium]
MVEIDAAVDEAGLLVSCSVNGHAGAGPRGGDVVCAAVSVLLRTAFRVLSDRQGIRLRGGAEERGSFTMETGCEAEGRAFLEAAGAFLLDGLESVAGLYPEYCNMTIRRLNRRN